MSLLRFDDAREIEMALGFFDLALSFASDSTSLASKLEEIAQFHGLRCYQFRNQLVRQSGFDIHAIMRHVYTTSGRVAVINSPGYWTSPYTRFERQLIRRMGSGTPIFVVGAGGKRLRFASHETTYFSAFSDNVAIEIVRTA
jgi:hypothetical protein